MSSLILMSSNTNDGMLVRKNTMTYYSDSENEENDVESIELNEDEVREEGEVVADNFAEISENDVSGEEVKDSEEEAVEEEVVVANNMFDVDIVGIFETDEGVSENEIDNSHRNVDSRTLSQNSEPSETQSTNTITAVTNHQPENGNDHNDDDDSRNNINRQHSIFRTTSSRSNRFSFLPRLPPRMTSTNRSRSAGASSEGRPELGVLGIIETRNNTTSNRTTITTPSPLSIMLSSPHLSLSSPPAPKPLPLRKASQSVIDLGATCRFCYETGGCSSAPTETATVTSATATNTSDQGEQQQQKEDPNQLVAPCACTGGQEWVHIRCLRRWQRHISSSPRQGGTGADAGAAGLDRAKICGVCRIPYSLPPIPRKPIKLEPGMLLVEVDGGSTSLGGGDESRSSGRIARTRRRVILICRVGSGSGTEEIWGGGRVRRWSLGNSDGNNGGRGRGRRRMGGLGDGDRSTYGVVINCPLEDDRIPQLSLGSAAGGLGQKRGSPRSHTKENKLPELDTEYRWGGPVCGNSEGMVQYAVMHNFKLNNAAFPRVTKKFMKYDQVLPLRNTPTAEETTDTLRLISNSSDRSSNGPRPALVDQPVLSSTLNILRVCQNQKEHHQVAPKGIGGVFRRRKGADSIGRTSSRGGRWSFHGRVDDGSHRARPTAATPTTGNDADANSESDDKNKVIVFAGFCRWGPGQCESEVEKGSWGVCRGSINDVLGQEQEQNLWRDLRFGDRLLNSAYLPIDDDDSDEDSDYEEDEED